ncbi:SPFH domain / Band 7 family protein [Chryseobacterium sp. RU37D]|nr:SPFH domain / Band 7 family protein [Chryseobacterium sp. RU37D]
MTFLLAPLIFFGLIILFASFFVVKQETAAIIERFGKFKSVKHSGLHLKLPIIDQIAKRLNLRIQQLDVIIDTKTLDNVFIKMKISVQYQVIRNQVADAYYRLENPENQITSFVFDVVRAEVPKMKLDDVFVRKDDIAVAVKGELQEAMNSYGYDIIKALVTDKSYKKQVYLPWTGEIICQILEDLQGWMFLQKTTQTKPHIILA